MEANQRMWALPPLCTVWRQQGQERTEYLNQGGAVAADADMAVKANLDELFDLPEGFYAVLDCTAGRATKQDQDNCPFFGCSRYFNAGMLCLNPKYVLLFYDSVV